MEFVPILALLSLVKKVIDLGKYITNRDMNGIVTTLAGWTAGVLAVVLFAQTNFADGIRIGDTALAALNFASQVAVGLTIGAGAGLAADFVSAKQPSDDPARLKLLPSATRSEARRRRTRGDDGAFDTETLIVVLLIGILVVLLLHVF